MTRTLGYDFFRFDCGNDYRLRGIRIRVSDYGDLVRSAFFVRVEQDGNGLANARR